MFSTGTNSLSPAMIMQLQTIMRRARRLDLLEADETADAVIDMDDEIARRQRRDFGEEICRRAFCGGAAARGGRPEYPARRSPPDRRRQSRLPARSPPARRGRRARPSACDSEDTVSIFLQPMFGKDRPQPLARAVAPAGDDNFLALALQGCGCDRPWPRTHWRFRHCARAKNCGPERRRNRSPSSCRLRARRKARIAPSSSWPASARILPRRNKARSGGSGL